MKIKIRKSIKQNWACLFILVFAFYIVASCTNPINQTILLHAKDKIAPEIMVLSPADESPFSSTVVVTGTVTDVSSQNGDSGKVQKMWYEVLGTDIKEDISFASDGSFAFQFETTNLSGHITVKITAVDWNGNQSDISLSLIDAGTGIPDFTITPGNHEITLTWDPVPLSESYTLHYTTQEGVPSETYGEHIDNVSSPYTLKNLENGEIHVFLLQSHSASGDDNWSSLKKAIPLSSFSLVPKVRAEYRKIVLEWPEIPGTDEFYVLRATQSDGAYSNVSGKITSNRYEDSDVEDNQLYFYKVVPSLTGSIESFYSQGMSSIFPGDWIEMKGVLIAFLGSYGEAAVSGNYLYTTFAGGFFGGSSSFHIKDISDPSNIVELSSIQGIGASDIKVKGTTAYIASGTKVNIIDVTDPANPVLENPCTGAVNIRGIDVFSDIIYAADGAESFEIYDPSDENSFPNPKVTIPTSDAANDVVVDNGYAYLAVGSAGVDVIDLSTNTIVTTCDTDGTASALAVDGNYLYVADDTAGLSVIDISTPSAASVITTLATPGNAVDISLKGKYACIADSGEGLILIDISNPASPFISGSDKTPLDAIKVASDGNTVCIIDDTGSGRYIELFRINDNHPDAVVHDVISSSGNSGLAMNGKYIFAGDNNIRIIDLSTHAVIGTYTTQYSDIGRFSLIGNYLFYGSEEELYGDGMLNILDISKAPNLTKITHFDFTSMMLGFRISGDYYYAVGDSGLVILDISNPQSTHQVGYLSLPGIGVDVAVAGHYAFIASYGAGLQVADVSNVRAPVRVGSVSIPDKSESIAAYGKYAYVGIQDASNEGQFQVVDISNPESPQLKGSIHLNRYPTEMTINGTYVYALSQAGFLYIIDVSDASNPFIENIVNLSLSAFPGIAIYGSTAYINTHNGVTLLDLTGGN
ncbi:MAG: hypothetical protein GXP33_01430 [Spirochaetes bacterium]|nr:hypothetical protein [Spirochaetota bacterium]